MSLYDDFEDLKQQKSSVAGWSAGIKLFQSQMQVKKANQSQMKRDVRKPAVTPAFNLKPKKDQDNSLNQEVKVTPPFTFYGDQQARDMDWNFEGNEYNPLWPNDYDKVIKDLRDLRDKEREKEEEERRKRRDERSKYRDTIDDRRRVGRKMSESDEDETESDKPSRGGVAIAPPPSVLQDTSLDTTPKINSVSGGSVAAKIMAKYGFKEGQGLGKKEQGISMALQVEKTSKRGGRIIHEKEMMPPPLMSFGGSKGTSGLLPLSPPPKEEVKSDPPSSADLLKNPSKIVLLKNMVGPGEVDEELEPEVKEECNTKYGDVVKVLIHELPSGNPEEAVRIFVEFKRIESAIKAIVDLNGRFFGGRQVKAGFYSQDKFEAFQLLD